MRMVGHSQIALEISAISEQFGMAAHLCGFDDAIGVKISENLSLGCHSLDFEIPVLPAWSRAGADVALGPTPSDAVYGSYN